MISETVWLTKLLLAHLLSDFILQPQRWRDQRYQKHFAAGSLYLHGLIIGILALLAVGFSDWPVAVFIMVTHVLIDGWKSYRPVTTIYLVADQLLHLLMITLCWWLRFGSADMALQWLSSLQQRPDIWKTITAFIFLTSPAGMLIGQLTRQWRDKIAVAAPSETESLANAGRWIGFAERTIILIFVLLGQYSAIGLLVAAKGIIRFNEKDRQEIKTEYLVVGTLLSISIAVLTGMAIKL
ncbi:DUF3307 domain-containing protein [Flavihumibacter petaseus]|uniref:DUF3307 domain-containing protein n=1 Tax=Flavihumibacter petaseus NBRC 106054 TaxID=1220578 RepID=A0A0E9N483_9BACT|nr:DUF3307 domain-containing protein [Flavihumibacter petaseus]GAO44598.1 hypothetical protein FPE01S_03_06360 [Flavihumibacter petaseus NBRC 106054]